MKLSSERSEQFDLSVIHGWDNASMLRNRWEKLSSEAFPWHPFFSYDWFSCWFTAFIPQEKIRIITVSDSSGELRAILPGFVEKTWLSGIPYNCFSFGANGHSPRGGIIARPGDSDAMNAAINMIFTQLDQKIHICVLPAVDKNSFTEQVIRKNDIPFIGIRSEHNFEAPFVNMSKGWDDYFKGRSSNLRKRIKNAKNRCFKKGEVDFQIFKLPENRLKVIERLKLLDSLTWQGKQGSGIFSNIENTEFYSNILNISNQKISVLVCFMTLDGKDVAYDLSIMKGKISHFLKCGYNPEFSKLCPGLMNFYKLGEYVSSIGGQEIDLGAEISEDKRRWETGRRCFTNYWLINLHSMKGKVIYSLAAIKDRFKSMK
jgi:CelD/BcsL family acetyltransferase involved in cellulose biosynthesis